MFKNTEETKKVTTRRDSIDGLYRLSGLQHGMLFHGLYDPGTGAYINRFKCDLIDLDLDIFNKSWDYVLKAHTILRTVFYHDKLNMPVQCVFKEVKMPIELLDYRSMSKENQVTAIKDYEDSDSVKGFDFNTAPLMRVVLIRLDEERYTMILTYHHIILDGWSISILMKEFLDTYETLASGKEVKVKELDRFEDFIRYTERIDKNKVQSYWKNYLKNIETGSLLPFIGKTAERNKGVGTYKSLYMDLDAGTTEQIQSYAKRNRITVNTVMQGVWSYCLHRYTGNKDILFGVIVSGRPDDFPHVEQRVGLYINPLPLHSEIVEDQKAVEWLQGLQDEQVSSRTYQHTPLHEIQTWTGIQGDMFDCLLTFENYPVGKILSSAKWRVKVENVQTADKNNYPLTTIITISDQINFRFSFNTELLKEEYVQGIVSHFKNVILQFIENEDSILRDIKILTQPEEHQLLKEFCSCEVKYPKDKSIVDLFEAQVKKTPDSAAVVFESEQLSFQDLNERSNKLAHYLRSKEVKEGTLVPLFIEPGLDMIVGILGILKSGGAYVPVDTELPLNRIAFMLKDTGANVIVSNSKSSLKLVNGIDAEVIESDSEEINLQSKENLPKKVSPDQPAYVIYTSGSTGTPKGVMIEHRALVDYVFGLENKIKVSECTSFGLVSSIATDLGNTVLYSSLLTGGALHLFSKEMTSDVQKLHKYFDENKIDCLKIVPSHWKALRMEEKLLLPEKLLVFGGEALQTELVEKIRLSDSTCRVVNHYGPTETTIGKLLHVIDFNQKYDSTIPIGKPFSNTSVYVLTKDLTLCPVGIPGQLYIAGDGLARGYLNNQDLTNEKFVKNPFKKNSLMYATGDLVKFLPDGSIEFIGRADEQVKVRGYRIELSEIENAIQQSEFVKESVVLAREDKQGNKRLIGYIIAKEKFDKEKLTAYLKEKLPEYMIPALFVELEGFPITASGKIDRQSLPDPEVSEQLTNEYLAPRSEAETALAGIWMELLDLDKVGIHDNFFELGGDSIITIQLVSRARRAGYELQVGDVFTYQTIARLSALLEQRSDKLFNVSGEQSVLEGECGLLPVQQWYLEKDPKDVSYFNQSVLLSIDKTITQSILKRAFEQLTSHHDSLRFKYYKKDNTWHQAYAPEAEISEVKVVDLQSADKQDLKKLIAEQAGQYQKSLDIEKGELMRVVLMQTPNSEAQNRLLIIIHHLAIDGVSWRILLEDLEHIVSGLKEGGKTDLPAKSSSYRQWYETLEKYGQSERLNSQKEYWDCQIIRLSDYQIHKIEEKIEEKSKELIKIKDTANISMRLSSEETKKLIQEVPRVYHTEINDILLSALAKTLCQYNGTDKVVIELEGHGRETIEEDVDSSRTVGWFTTHYPLKLEINKNENNSEGELIKSVKETLRRVPDKGLGYGVLKYINREASLQDIKNPDIKFNYLGQTDNVLSSGKLFTLATEPTGASASEESIVSNRLTVNAIIQSGELILNWSYSKKHFNEKEIKSIVDAYQKNLESLITHCTQQQQKSGAVFTPSDYGLGKEVSYEELDKFLNEEENGKPRRESIESLYRLSGLQQGMLFHGLYDTETGTYIRQLGCNVYRADIEAFKKSWDFVMKRHSALRSAFYHDVFSIPVQCVYREAELPVEVLDIRDKNKAEQLRSIKEYVEADRLKGFDYKSVPLMRVCLIHLSEDSYHMLLSWHHLLFDGWSMPVMMEEFLRIYEQLIKGKEVIATEADRYEDYIRYIEHVDKQKEEIFWREYLEGLEQSTFLPFIGATTERNRGAGVYETLSLQIDKTPTTQIQNYAQRHGLTVNTLMQGVWSYLLHLYTGSSNITYGVVVSGRPDDLLHIEKRVGMYINTLPLHSILKKEKKISEWLKDLQLQQVSSRQHQYTPLQDIQGWTEVQGDLFDTIIGFENYPISKVISSEKWSLHVEGIEIHEQTNYPLTIVIGITDQTSIRFRYNTDLLKEIYVKEISRHFENVLMQIVTKEDISLSEIELLTETEKNQLLTEFNNTDADYSEDKTIIDLFEEQVLKTPESTALVFGEQQLTYKELNERSNQLAHYLRSKGVKEEKLIPLCLERGMDMIIGILGILKAGGAYVPIDPEYPEERINYILKDTAASIAVSSKESRLKLSADKELGIVEIDGAIGNQPKENLQKVSSPHQLAYIIYTSGSTGNPKGVMIEHRNLFNYLVNNKTKYTSNEKDSAGSFIHLSYTFDASITGMFMPLLRGKTVVVSSKKSLEVFEDLNLQKYAPYDFIKITPSHLEMLNSKMKLSDGRMLTNKLVIGGEALLLSQLSYLIEEELDVEIINEYGPTEATVGCSTYCFETSKINEVIKNNLSIGKPVDNCRIYILGEQNELLPVGVHGEICIGGAGIARGYLNLTELTAEKFVKDPFSKEPGARLYRTGDKGAWLPDGNIEYSGRIDDQVKIRGYRIEPGEIEKCLSAINGIKNAKVIVTENEVATNRKLNAYVQIDKNKLPLLSNYQSLLSKDQLQKSDLNILPNGLPILSHNLNEVKFLYKEIFEDHCYLKHGITLAEDSCVIDIGANVGFFTVFLNLLSDRIKVYSFEPIPEVYDFLSANRELYDVKGKAFNLAILDSEREIDFTYYPQVSIVSGISEDVSEVKEVVRSYIENSENGELQRQDIDSLLEVKLESKKIKVKAKTISQIIEDEKIEKIDLLKVDVENSEHLVLSGLSEQDWAKVNSVIIEIHDVNGRLNSIKELLEQKGFKTYVEKEQMLSKDDILFNLFALRDDHGKGLSTMGDNDKHRLPGWNHPMDFVKKIRTDLEKKLPDYMIPSNIILLDQFPLTRNGKIDKKALPKPDVSEALSNDYSAPRNEFERVVTEIWQELLDIDHVGLHDNFFELGGDSIIIIQIVSRARREGFEFQVADIFTHQTIASLSAFIDRKSDVSPDETGEQGMLTGSCGLLPIQQWYFESAGEEISHFNQAVLLSIDKSVTPEILESAVKQLVSHHDALRFRYNKEAGQWNQEYGTNTGELITVDLSSAQKDSLGNLIKEHADKYQSSLNIEKGDIARFVLIQTPETESNNRILMVIHHLAIDGVSWRIILDDLELLLSGLQKNEKAELGSKSSSYRQWYEALEQYGQSRRLLSQVTYWEKTADSYEPITVDKSYKGIVTAKDVRTEKLKLDSEQTQLLLQEVPRVYHTEINDILLCALALTICEWSSKEKVTVGLEGHGRENISESIDTSRTAGWFTNLYPVLLEITKGNLSDSIKAVKEQLRRVPDKGLGYGVLKYINKYDKLSGKQCRDIVFNYLGQLDNVVGSGKLLSGAGESRGASVSEENILSDNLSVNAMVQGGELILNWNYSSKHYKKVTITGLTEKYKSNLESLISHCIDQQKKSGAVYTPSDYGIGQEIDYTELDKFLDEPYRGNVRKDFVEGMYRLSGLQQGMLFHSLYDSGAGAYTEQLSCDLINPDLVIITGSWNNILKRHSILRSGFYSDEFSIPVQCVYKDVELPVTLLDYSDMNPADQTSAIKEYEEADRLKGFDFKSVPLMRIALIRLSENRYRMLWTSHHILFDGWSLQILMEEFLNTYELLVSGKDLPKTEEDRYEDYIRYIDRDDKDIEEKYWRDYMKGAEQSTLLPFIGTTSQRTKGVGTYKTLLKKFDTETTSRIENYTQKHHITINTLIQGVWSCLLHSYTGNDDVVFGVIVSGRPDDLPGIEHRVGMYINTIPLHSKMQEDTETVKWLQSLQDSQVSSRGHERTPLQDIQGWTGVQGDLFDSLLVFENYPVNEIIRAKQWSLKVENVYVNEQTNYPLTIIVGGAQQMFIKFSYNADILYEVYVKQISSHFENVLMQIITKEESRVSDIELLPESEKKKLLFEFNDTESGYPKDKTVIALFEEQVLKSPDDIALVFEDKKLTYKELNELSNQLGHYLRNKGVREDTIVPVCIERSIEMIAGVMGILKAGGAYLPIDPDYPEDRINFMLEDSKSKVAVCGLKSILKLPKKKDLDIVDLNTDWKYIEKNPVENLNVINASENLTYVLYTSGSTGNPKGVQMAGRSLVNLLNWQEKQFVNKQRRVLQFASLNFDVSFQEIFSTLCYGSTLYLINEMRRIDLLELLNDIVNYRITHLFLPYVVLKNLAESIPSEWDESYTLEEIIVAGEQLKITADLRTLLNKRNIRLINQYGPTESHVVSSYVVDENSPLLPPIGKPVDNTKLFILNGKNKLAPVGVPGELHIAGVQVARGYLNRPELTKEKFVNDTFSKESGSKIYKSGDTARWLPDGNLEYLGRGDDQVKIRGYRIELGEIESLLQHCDLVKEAVVLAKEDLHGNKRLVGYIIPEGEFDRDGLSIWLKQKLPDYMVPSIWVEMKRFPLTGSGKTDRLSLPEPDSDELISNKYVAPRNETEEKLANIWQQMLQVKQVGIYDNFFDLGGHSLLAMRVIAAIRKEFTLNIPIKALFEFTSIADLSKYIELAKSNSSKEKTIYSEVFEL